MVLFSFSCVSDFDILLLSYKKKISGRINYIHLALKSQYNMCLQWWHLTRT